MTKNRWYGIGCIFWLVHGSLSFKLLQLCLAHLQGTP
jgi:hypothetical protein